MKKKNLSPKAKSISDRIDDAVLDVLIQSNIPLYPEDISNELNIPRSPEREMRGEGTSFPTARDSLFRLLKKQKVKRTPKRHKHDTQAWYIP